MTIRTNMILYTDLLKSRNDRVNMLENNNTKENNIDVI